MKGLKEMLTDVIDALVEGKLKIECPCGRMVPDKENPSEIDIGEDGTTIIIRIGK